MSINKVGVLPIEAFKKCGGALNQAEEIFRWLLKLVSQSNDQDLFSSSFPDSRTLFYSHLSVICLL